MATYTRRAGTLHTCAEARCDHCSEFDGDGFAIQRPTDPDGVRCWTFWTVGAHCTDCGQPI